MERGRQGGCRWRAGVGQAQASGLDVACAAVRRGGLRRCGASSGQPGRAAPAERATAPAAAPRWVISRSAAAPKAGQGPGSTPQARRRSRPTFCPRWGRCNACGAHAAPQPGCRPGRGTDLDVVVDAVVRAFAAQARLLTPPKGTSAVEIRPVLMPTMPYSSASPTREDAAHVAAVEVARQAELGVVGHRDGLGLGLEGNTGATGPKVSFRAQHVAGDVSQHRRRVEAFADLLPPTTTVAPRSPTSATWRSTLPIAWSSISGPWLTPASEPLPTFDALALSASLATKAS